MTDEQWNELTRQLKVPIAGRKSLEALLFEFQEKVSLKARVELRNSLALQRPGRAMREKS